MMKNYYGSLCTEMYEILHPTADQDELDFFLSYAKKEMKILEPLCGTGRFMIPFLERGFDITGMDLSKEMLNKLLEKKPQAKVFQSDILAFEPNERYDYIMIPAGSLSLFTDMDFCKKVLLKLRNMLKEDGVFVFACETLADRCDESTTFKQVASVQPKQGQRLILKQKDHYDEGTQTQYSFGIYELYEDEKLVQSEQMDFQTHLYAYHELDSYLKEIGFQKVVVYSSFDKTIASDDSCEMFLYECHL